MEFKIGDWAQHGADRPGRVTRLLPGGDAGMPAFIRVALRGGGMTTWVPHLCTLLARPGVAGLLCGGHAAEEVPAWASTALPDGRRLVTGCDCRGDLAGRVPRPVRHFFTAASPNITASLGTGEDEPADAECEVRGGAVRCTLRASDADGSTVLESITEVDGKVKAKAPGRYTDRAGGTWEAVEPQPERYEVGMWRWSTWQGSPIRVTCESRDVTTTLPVICPLDFLPGDRVRLSGGREATVRAAGLGENGRVRVKWDDGCGELRESMLPESITALLDRPALRGEKLLAGDEVIGIADGEPITWDRLVREEVEAGRVSDGPGKRCLDTGAADAPGSADVVVAREGYLDSDGQFHPLPRRPACGNCGESGEPCACSRGLFAALREVVDAPPRPLPVMDFRLLQACMPPPISLPPDAGIDLPTAEHLHTIAARALPGTRVVSADSGAEVVARGEQEAGESNALSVRFRFDAGRCSCGVWACREHRVVRAGSDGDAPLLTPDRHPVTRLGHGWRRRAPVEPLDDEWLADAEHPHGRGRWRE